MEAIAEAAEQAVPGEIDDDMAIVVVRTSAVELASRERNFPAEPIRVSEARRLAHQTFTSWGMDCEPGRPGLPAGLRGGHERGAARRRLAEPPARVRPGVGRALDVGQRSTTGRTRRSPRTSPARRRGSSRSGCAAGTAAVWVEVFDPDLRLPRIRSAGENDEGGRGLYLVDQLATRWGSRPTQDGKAVWFEIPIKGRRRPALTAPASGTQCVLGRPTEHEARAMHGPGDDD